MRCGRCGKNFDEEMYSGICPKCGHFNNRQKEYDVSGYFSAKFDDGGKVSTSAQAAKQHEQLHRAYDSSNMHKTGAGQHEKLHQMYDSFNMHSQTAKPNAQAAKPLSGYQQTSAGRQGVPLGKTNPYQTAQTVTAGKTYPAGNSGTYSQNKYGKANAYGEEKGKNLVTPICVIIAVLAIVGTVFGSQLKRQSLERTCYTLDFEQETAQAGEIFELNERLLVVDEAKVVDTSALEGMPEGEKLVAVTVEILPVEERVKEYENGEVYVSDGSSYKIPLGDYTVMETLYNGDYSMSDDVLSEYSFYGYIPTDGEYGDCYFFVDEDAEEIMISFEERSKKNGLYVLRRRVSVPLQLGEGGEDE